jgi:hypothetical protein
MQDDWVSLLPLAEFAYNNTLHTATQVSPFFANKGFNPRLEVSLTSVPSLPAHQMATDLKDLHEYLRQQILVTRSQYEEATADRRLPIPDLIVGDKVWLDTRNIRTTRPSKKLDHRRAGPFPIIEKISSHAYRLGLPLAYKDIHNVFHVSLLEPHTTSKIPNRHSEPPPPVTIVDEQQYEVSEVVDSKFDRRFRPPRLFYLAKWTGYGDQPDSETWEPAENFEHAPRIVREFHKLNPLKPGPVPQ